MKEIEGQSIPEECAGSSAEKLAKLISDPDHDSSEVIKIAEELISELEQPNCVLSGPTRELCRQKYEAIVQTEKRRRLYNRHYRMQEYLSQKPKDDINSGSSEAV